MKSAFSKVRLILIALVVMFAATSASAETLMMPKRDATKGTAVVVWGASTLSGNYSIDFGDGTAVYHSSVTGGFGNQNYYLATTHTYAAGGNYTATLTIGAETATVAIQVFDPATTTADNLRSLGVNMAIQDGLRSLYVNQSSQDLTNTTTNWGNGFPYADASFIVLAFENHGYTLPNSNAAPTGIYQKYVVRRGLNYVLSQLSQIGLSNQPAGNPCVGSGTGWVGSDCVGFAPPGDQGYSTAIAILPFAASGALSRVNTEVGGVTVNKTYGEVLQRLVNAEAWGQTDGVGSTTRGGFGYNFNGGQFDGSTAGWAILCFLDAEAAGATVPAFVKTEFKFGFNNALNTDGTFDYSGDGCASCDNSVGPQKNGIGLQGLYFIGETTGSRVDAVKATVSSWWNGSTGTGGNSWGGCSPANKGCAYTMFNNFKGLKLHGITTLPGVTRAAGPGTQPAGDWYSDYQDYLVSSQQSPNAISGGSWNMGFSCCYSGTNLVSAIGELILSPVALVLPDEQKFSTVGLSPATHTALEGTSHTVTAKAESTGGTPVPGATVNFKILTGPNAGLTGTGTTDSSGLATFTYTDPVGHTGTDTIQATIGNLTSNSVTATWTPLNAPPDAVNDAASTNSGTAVSISVLSNDTDPDHDVLTVTSATQGAHGSTFVNGNGTITYTPNNGFAGTDTFTYAISDGKGGVDSASVTVTVTKIGVTATATGGTFVYSGVGKGGSCSFIASDNSAVQGTLTYSGGSAPVNVSSTTVSCDFDGTGTNFGSAHASAAIDITPAPTTTVVTCSNAVYTGAAQETCSASATSAEGFGQDLAVSYSNNTNVGTATGAASFAGDANHSASNASATFQITPASTTTAVTCSNVVYNGAAQETCSAVVTGVNGFSQSLPVTYTNNTNVGTATGSATFAGNANYSGSTSSSTFQITQAPTTIAVTCSNVIYNGAAQETCSAVVTGVNGFSQTLPVTYANNTNAGTATGNATFAGNANYSGSSSSATFDIAKATSTTVVTCPASVTYSGSAQTPCSANVTGAGGLNESVAVTYANNTNAGTASASANFGGDANHTGSADAKTFTINQAPTTTTSVNAPTIMVAANGTVTVTVNSGSGTVIGNVTLTVDGGAPITGTLSGGSAIFTLASPNAGDHALVANYAAQGNFAASTGTGNLHVNPAPTSTVLTTSVTPQLAGTAVTFTATVAATAPGTGTPNGIVTFKEGTTVLGTGTLSGGVATFTTTTLSNGPHTITAVYNGVNNYLTSTSNTVSKLIFGLAAGGGTFVIGDNNAILNASVNFWGSQWEKSNSLTGGASNASFKGFASGPAIPGVGQTFTAAPGNSAPPPAGVPQYIGIIVTSKVTKSGSNITGTIVHMVVVRVDAGYAGDPGHAGTGTIVAFIQ